MNLQDSTSWEWAGCTVCSWKNGSLPDFSLAESTSEASCCMCEINECMQVTRSLPCIPYADAAVIFKVICALSHALHIISVAMICQPYVYPMHHAYVCTGLLLFTAVYTYIWKREATAFACLTDHIKKKMLYLTPADIYLRSLRPLQVDAVFYVLKGSVKWNGLVIVTYHFAA